MTKPERLTREELYRSADLGDLEFESTAELEPYEGVLGQLRAVDAVRFGLGIEAEGYNLFALGPSGTGKKSILMDFLNQRAADAPIPHDWLYVNNFEHPHKPDAIALPAGKGVQFEKDMEQLIEEISSALEGAFESEEYQNRRQEIQEEFQEQQEAKFEELRKTAKDKGFALLRTPSGLGFAPERDGEVVAPEEFQELSKEEREEIEKEVSDLQDDLQQILRQLPRLQRQMQSRLRELNREMANLAAGGHIQDLRERYSEFEEIVAYLAAVEEDVVDNVRDFLQQDENSIIQAQMNQAAQVPGGNRRPGLRRYKVNLLVDHSVSAHGPVVEEDNPTYPNLIGRVEHVPQMGALLTDFNLIKPGALHLANGGYLILDARKVLIQPYAWEGLKRVLRSEEIRIESPGQAYGLITTVSLEPEPIPLDVKVALVGDRTLYYLLSALDPEFDELFKVMADFENDMDRDVQSQKSYARLIAGLARKEDLRPFERRAVERLIEHSSRLASDSDKLTAQMGSITDLMREASYWAKENGNGAVTEQDVESAIAAKIQRADRLRDRMQEAILRETILIDTEGEKTGQINGLSVIQLGEFAFGGPNRITARIRLGRGRVVDIERESELGGAIHSKGVMILAGYLGARYAAEVPLSLSASLVFEQSYGGVEGDSASSAELYALLSAIADVPIKQSLAVTGSVNQHGEIQAIGGVNEKIEGFFDICAERGLTGDQGVLIPRSNVKHLMLREDVIEAVEHEKFHIYPVDDIDQGIELLTDLSAGEQDDLGEYPQGTFNARVSARLRELARLRKDFKTDEPGGGDPV